MTTPNLGVMRERTKYKKYLSFSGVDQFSNCERRYFFERILMRRQPDTAITLVGRTYHEAIAAMIHTRVPRTHEWTEFVVDEAVKRNHDALTALGVACGSLRQEMVSNLARLKAEVLEPAGVITLDQVVQCGMKRAWWVERAFEARDIGFKGVVDLLSTRAPVVDAGGTVTGGVAGRCVWDWKSVTSDRRRSQRDATTSAQLATYAIGANVRRACFVEIPRNLAKDIRVRLVEYSEEELAHWASWLRSMHHAIMSRGKVKANFRPSDRKNPLCSPDWCNHYLTECYPTESPLTPLTEEATVGA